jgi:hypothetical protein
MTVACGDSTRVNHSPTLIFTTSSSDCDGESHRFIILMIRHAHLYQIFGDFHSAAVLVYAHNINIPLGTPLRYLHETWLEHSQSNLTFLENFIYKETVPFVDISSVAPFSFQGTLHLLMEYLLFSLDWISP